MTKKTSNSKSSSSTSASRKAAPPVTVSRNTPVPRTSSLNREVTHDMIARRAFEIHISGKGSDQLGNWLRAERELRSL